MRVHTHTGEREREGKRERERERERKSCWARKKGREKWENQEVIKRGSRDKGEDGGYRDRVGGKRWVETESLAGPCF